MPDPLVAAFLRGVNVGGRSRLAMADLRRVVEGLGHGEVRTVLQSGNVVLRPSGLLDTGELARAIERETGVVTTVLVRTHAELAAAVDANPFAGDEDDGARLHLVLLDRAPEAQAVAALDPDRSAGDRFHVDGHTVYLHLPNGAHRSKLTVAWLEKTLSVRATARNAKTMARMVELTAR